MSVLISPGDEITVDRIVGLKPDGSLIIRPDALQEELAVWRAIGTVRAEPEESAVCGLDLVRQGKVS